MIKTPIPIGCARALGQKQAYELALLRKRKKTSPGSELVYYLSCNAVVGVLKRFKSNRASAGNLRGGSFSAFTWKISAAFY
jgi:hypothetical protein